MNFYVYIIKSSVRNIFYKGFSEHPLLRLQQHNNGECKYTSEKGPWMLVYLEIFPTKKEALIREKAIKHYSHQQIDALIQSNKNKLALFLLNYNS